MTMTTNEKELILSAFKRLHRDRLARTLYGVVDWIMGVALGALVTLAAALAYGWTVSGGFGGGQ